MFQGTLESNLSEGAVIVEAYNMLRYDAVTIGNHEFDFGPTGPHSTPQSPSEDARGALLARARQARFPFLSANLAYENGQPFLASNVLPSVIKTVAGIKVGLIGLATESTPRTTISTNFVGLRILPLAATLAAEATRLRGEGAKIIVTLAHAGGDCRHGAVDDLTNCKPDEEIFEVARALPQGLVDVIVGGHTHARVAHHVNGIAIIESLSVGAAFGRVDLTIDRNTHRVARDRIYEVQRICQEPASESGARPACTAQSYEGRRVRANTKLARLAKRAAKRADAIRNQSLPLNLQAPLLREYRQESQLGRFIVDAFRLAVPDADVWLMNAGGVRANLPAGPVTYGELYEVFPFDNRVARVSISGAALTELVKRNLEHDNGIALLSGIRATARCEGPALKVTVVRENGLPITPHETVRLATSDFLALGGDGLLAGIESDVSDVLIRDAIAGWLHAHHADSGAALAHINTARLLFPAARPVTCAAPASGAAQ